MKNDTQLAIIELHNDFNDKLKVIQDKLKSISMYVTNEYLDKCL